MSITNYNISNSTNNRQIVSSDGIGCVNSASTFCISTYTSGNTGLIGFSIQGAGGASSISGYTGTQYPQQMTLWLDNLTTNTDFTLQTTSSNLNLSSAVSINTNSLPICSLPPVTPYQLVNKNYVDMSFGNTSITHAISITGLTGITGYNGSTGNTGSLVAIDLGNYPFKVFDYTLANDYTYFGYTGGVANGNYQINLTGGSTGYIINKKCTVILNTLASCSNNLSGPMLIAPQSDFILKVHFNGTKYLTQFINFT